MWRASHKCYEYDGAHSMYRESSICMSSHCDLLTDSRTEDLLDLCSDVER